MNIILFDGVCNLCNGVVVFLIKRDKKALFRFATIQSGTGELLLERYNIKSKNTTLYYFRDDVCFIKSTAILHILRDLGGGWRFFYSLIVIPACLRDAIYLFISRNRYRWFGKKNDCIIPTREIRNRFLD